MMPSFFPPQRFYLSQKSLQQRRRIVVFPNQVKWEADIHINNREQNDSSGTVPTHGFGLPRKPNPALNKAQIGVAIRCLLNNARSAEPTASTRLHHSIIEDWIDPAGKPDERNIPQIPQSNCLPLR